MNPATSFIIGPADKANVYLMLTNGLIRIPNKPESALLTELIAKYPYASNLKSNVTALLKATLPITDLSLAAVSDAISEHIGSALDIILVDLRPFNLNVDLLHRLMVSVHEGANIKFTADEYLSLQPILGDSIKYVKPFEEANVADWKKAMDEGNKTKSRLYADLFASSSHLFTPDYIVKCITDVNYEGIFALDNWTITEDSLFEIMKKYADESKIIPDLRFEIMKKYVDESKIIADLRLKLISNRTLMDPLIKSHPHFYQEIYGRIDNEGTRISGSRKYCSVLDKDYLMVLEKKLEIHNIDGKKYVQILSVYPEIAKCASIIYAYLSKYKSFNEIMPHPDNTCSVGLDADNCLSIESGKNKTVQFINLNGKFSIDKTYFAVNPSIREYKRNSYCIYVRSD